MEPIIINRGNKGKGKDGLTSSKGTVPWPPDNLDGPLLGKMRWKASWMESSNDIGPYFSDVMRILCPGSGYNAAIGVMACAVGSELHSSSPVPPNLCCGCTLGPRAVVTAGSPSTSKIKHRCCEDNSKYTVSTCVGPQKSPPDQRGNICFFKGVRGFDCRSNYIHWKFQLLA